MTGQVRSFGAVVALLALVAPGAHPISAQNPAQVSNTPQGGFMLKMNAELVLTNVVARDAKTGELVHGPQAERLQDLRKRQATADRHLRL